MEELGGQTEMAKRLSWPPEVTIGSQVSAKWICPQMKLLPSTFCQYTLSLIMKEEPSGAGIIQLAYHLQTCGILNWNTGISIILSIVYSNWLSN